MLRTTLLTTLILTSVLASDETGLDLTSLRQPPRNTTPRILPSLAELRSEFTNPPVDHRTGCYWYWGGESLTKEGISKDLEAMRRAGLGTTVICFHSGGKPKEIGKKVESVPYGSDAWHEVLQHTIREAARLGIRLGIFIGPGYRGTGGPWVKPEQGMQSLFIETMRVKGPGRVEKPWPAKPFKKPKHGDPKLAQQLHGKPDEILLVAVPSEAKSTAKGKSAKGSKAGVAVTTAGQKVLTDHLSKDLIFSWDVPKGSWTVIRFYSVRQGSAMGVTPFKVDEGLHIDKYSPKLLAWNLEQYLGRILREAGPLVGNTLALFHHDSQECGKQTWATNLEPRFEERFGYDPRPWLPVLAGVTVEDAEQSRRFRWDYARLRADMAREYAAVIANWAHSKGIRLSSQRIMLGGNGVETYSCADICSTESWLRKVFKFVDGDGRRVLQAAIADYQGRSQVSCESFTHIRNKFNVAPSHLKAEGDALLASGANFIWLHVYGLQPADIPPGVAPYGVAFNRLQPWWDLSEPWFDHLNRIQTVQQQTSGTAQILTVAGRLGKWDSLHVRPEPQFSYSDICPADALADLKVVDGQVVSPVGNRYPVLYLVEDGDYTLEDLQNLKRLHQAGAQIHGDADRPTHPPGRRGYPGSDQEYATLVGELWGKSITKGRPKVTPTVANNKGLLWSHRRLGDTEFFFLANPTEKEWSGTPQFAVTGKRPELWRPGSGTMSPLACYRSSEGATDIPLRLRPEESLFVVFVGGQKQGRHLTAIDGPQPVELQVTEQGFVIRSTQGGRWTLKDDAGTTSTVTLKQPPAPFHLGGRWQVTTKPARGESSSLVLDRLTDMANKAPPGRLLYQLEFELPPAYVVDDLRCTLDLGKVGHAARVTLNGQDLGALAYAPFTVPLATALKAGTNSLLIEVAPTWDKPNKKRAKDGLDKPGASWGLIGPVSITAARQASVP